MCFLCFHIYTDQFFNSKWIIQDGGWLHGIRKKRPIIPLHPLRPPHPNRSRGLTSKNFCFDTVLRDYTVFSWINSTWGALRLTYLIYWHTDRLFCWTVFKAYVVGDQLLTLPSPQFQHMLCGSLCLEIEKWFAISSAVKGLLNTRGFDRFRGRRLYRADEPELGRTRCPRLQLSGCYGCVRHWPGRGPVSMCLIHITLYWGNTDTHCSSMYIWVVTRHQCWISICARSSDIGRGRFPLSPKFRKFRSANK